MAALRSDAEMAGLMRALGGRFVAPVPGGDLVRSPEILPAGRNVHAFDPFRMPTAHATRDGAAQAELLLRTHAEAHGAMPRSVALVLWGSDSIKSDGVPVAQAMALLGARPRFDHYGRLTGAELIPLAELGRARVDVVMTLSGIFRDLLPLQVRMLAEAAFLAATADEPDAMNAVRAHARAQADASGCTLEAAALRVFSNADGAYGSNVNHLVDSGMWDDEGELADAYQARKGFAYGRDGKAAAQPGLLQAALGRVDLAYQNLESVELGVTTVDHYFDTLGGISRAVKRAKGTDAPVYIGDQTMGAAKVRTLEDQVALETRSRSLNPRWFEGLLKHGAEGRAPDRGAGDEHAGLVGHDRRGRALGLPAPERDLRAGRGDAPPPGRVEPEGQRAHGQPAPGGGGPRLLDPRRRDAGRVAGRRGRVGRPAGRDRGGMTRLRDTPSLPLPLEGEGTHRPGTEILPSPIGGRVGEGGRAPARNQRRAS